MNNKTLSTTLVCLALGGGYSYMKKYTENLTTKLNKEELKELKKSNNEKKSINSIFVENEEVIYDVTVDRQDFITTLENNLQIYENNELYEGCAKIVKAIQFLKELKEKKKSKK